MSGERSPRLGRRVPDFESIVQLVDEGIVVLRADGVLAYINPAAMRMCGVESKRDAAEFFDRVLSSPCYYADGTRVPQDLRPAALAFRRGSFTREIFGIEMPGGGRRWLLASGHLLNPDDPSSDMLLSFSDITAQRENLHRLTHQANHDPLTGLPNRAVVLHKMAESLASAGGGRLRAVSFVDLDALKSTNDTWGHEAGDELLKAAAARLRQSVGPTDVVGRLGGDEFVLLIHGDATHRELADWVARLRVRLAEPVTYAATTVRLRASVGIVDVNSHDGRSVEEILHAADRAMYDAKRAAARLSRVE